MKGWLQVKRYLLIPLLAVFLLNGCIFVGHDHDHYRHDGWHGRP